jgi:predicted outer membrane protein
VKQFARKMIDDHTKLNEQMRSVTLQLSVEIPTEVSKKDKSLMNKLQPSRALPTTRPTSKRW